MTNLPIEIVSSSSESEGEGIEATLRVLANLQQVQETIMVSALAASESAKSQSPVSRHLSSSTMSDSGSSRPKKEVRGASVNSQPKEERASDRDDIPVPQLAATKSISSMSTPKSMPSDHEGRPLNGVAPLRPSNKKLQMPEVVPSKKAGLFSCCYRANEQVITSADDIPGATNVALGYKATTSTPSQRESKKVDEEQGTSALNDYERAMIERLRELLSLDTSIPTLPSHVNIQANYATPVSLDITDSQIAHTFSIDTKELHSMLSKEQPDTNNGLSREVSGTQKKFQVESKPSMYASISEPGKTNTLSKVESQKFSRVASENQSASIHSRRKKQSVYSASNSTSSSVQAESTTNVLASSSASRRSGSSKALNRENISSPSTVPKASSSTSSRGQNHQKQKQASFAHSSSESQELKGLKYVENQPQQDEERAAQKTESNTSKNTSQCYTSERGCPTGSKVTSEGEPNLSKACSSDSKGKPPIPEKEAISLSKSRSRSVLTSANSTKSSIGSQVRRSMSRSSTSKSSPKYLEVQKSSSGSLKKQTSRVSYSEKSEKTYTTEVANRQNNSRLGPGPESSELRSTISLKGSRSASMRSRGSIGSRQSLRSRSSHESEERLDAASFDRKTSVTEERDQPLDESILWPPKPELVRKRKDQKEEIIAVRGEYGGNENEDGGFECIYQLETVQEMNPLVLQKVRSEQPKKRLSQRSFSRSFRRAGSADAKYGPRGSLLTHAEKEILEATSPEDAVLDPLPSDPAIEKASSLLAQAPKDIRDDISDLGMLSPKHLTNTAEKENASNDVNNGDQYALVPSRKMDVLDLFSGGMFCCQADSTTSV